ncbi:hypothetical protein QAD02_004310 [Eretmocerus hayati]|uniref:Uncharacterized protein n=1 Tax=Eretmocerus hayati TaxID=131215 RepID=A0ACC2NPN4_9HYME|nr:hypothetical protein QAD02_004310 [Eretmocerus hayati]
MFLLLIRIILASIVLTLLPEPANCEFVGGFYSDNGMDQTEIYHKMTPKERRGMGRGISRLLDLPVIKHIPINDSIELQESSYAYMSTIYTNSKDVMVKESDIVMAYGASLNKSKPRELLFDLSETPDFGHVLGAELHLHFKKVIKPQKILIHLRMDPKFEQRKTRSLRLVNSANVSTGYEGWMKINVTAALQYWMSHSVSIPKLILRCVSLNGKKVAGNEVNGICFDLGQPATQPFLTAFFTEPTATSEPSIGMNQRRKRSNEIPNDPYPKKITARKKISSSRAVNVNVASNDPGSIAKELVRRWNLENPFVPVFQKHRQPRWEYRPTRGVACHLHGLHVRFSELGFQNFILMPSSFEARYCAGECRFPLKHSLNATKHAIVQTLVNFLYPDKVPPACCAPTELEPLAVIYRLDNRRFVYRKYRDMIVNACGCH